MSDQDNNNASQPSPVELTRKWFELVWNQRDENTIHKMMCTTCITHGIGQEKSGPEGFTPFFKNFMAVFDGVNIEVLDVTGDDHRSAGHCLFSGLHKKSGKKVSFEFSFGARWENGLIVESRNVVDFLSLLEQLGEVNSSALTSALTA